MKYTIGDTYTPALCEIFHKELRDHEQETSTIKLEFGKFMVKPLVNLTNTYGIWFDGKYMGCVQDEVGHTFSMWVKNSSYITQNMVVIVLNCLVAAHKKWKSTKPVKLDELDVITVKEQKKIALDAVHDIMAEYSDHFSTDEMSEMSEMLYGKENKRLLRKFNR